MYQYTLKRSSRKTISMRILVDGILSVRAPLFISKKRIDAFVESKKDWIEKHIQSRIIRSSTEKIAMKKSLEKYITSRVRALHENTGLPAYRSIKITSAERRWGSCSARNGFCFSYRLAEFLPEWHAYPHLDQRESLAYIDAIIVHELAHLREKNHQRSFWNLVYSMMPEYDRVLKHVRN